MKFILISDSHIGAPAIAYQQQQGYPEHLPEIIAALDRWIRTQKDVAFVLHAGDMVDEATAPNIKLARQLFQLSVPVYLCLGNHDLDAPDALALWLKHAPDFFPGGAPNYTIEDNLCAIHVRPNQWDDVPYFWGSKQDAHFLAEQTSSIAAANTLQFLCTHSPAFGVPPEQTGFALPYHAAEEAFQTEVLALVRQNPAIRWVLSGHSHLNMRVTHEGTQFVTVSSFAEVPFEAKVFEISASQVSMETISLREQIQFPTVYDSNKAYVQGRAIDRTWSEKSGGSALSARIVPLLLKWYDAHARVLPWRDEPTPYQVWVSEIMLQQTRVEAVLSYFHLFTETLPTVEALARADEQQLLKLWEGLGYYSRVRNLQKAAQRVVDEFGGTLPQSFEALKTLPGIGDYSAGAIASIAYQIRVPAVDGNVLRVITRVTADPSDITLAATKKRITEAVAAILPTKRVGDFNQALMEIGAMVCLPNGAPKCEVCPLQGICLSFVQGLTGQIPVKTKKKGRRIEKKTVFLLVCNNQIALRKRTNSGLLANFWEFPHVEGSLTKPQAMRQLLDWGWEPDGPDGLKEGLKKLADEKHIFSHIEWHMKAFFVPVSHVESAEPLIWVTRDQLRREIALPSAFQYYKQYF
ncbi:MAG: A/G-specific adenine glycosylase [Clostridia bacterium]